MIWTIIELEENIMVLNNVTKFHKILIKIFEIESGRRSGGTYVKYAHTYGRTDRGNT